MSEKKRIWAIFVAFLVFLLPACCHSLPQSKLNNCVADDSEERTERNEMELVKCGEFVPFYTNCLRIDLPQSSEATAEKAYRQLLPILEGMRWDSKNFVAGRLENPEQEEALKKLLALRLKDRMEHDKGTSEYLRVLVPLYGKNSLLRVLLSEEEGCQHLSDEKDEIPLPRKVGGVGRLAIGPTGVLIDCRGLSIHPAVLPELLDEAGRIVYTSHDVPYELIVMSGMVFYTGNLMQAREFAGRNIIEVKARGIEKDCCPLIQKEDADCILQATRENRILRNGRVVFLVDDESFGVFQKRY